MEEIKKFFKHLLMVSLITTGLSIILAISILSLSGNNHGNADILVMFVAVGAFFGSIIIYFFYFIKKLKWFFGFIAVLIVIVVIKSAIISFGVDVYFTNLFNNSHLPEQYNEYQDIKNPVLEFKNKEMKLLAGGCTNLNQYLSPQNNLIVGGCVRCRLPDTTKGKKTTYYKFDSKGDFITKYSPSGDEEILFEGYLVNMNKEYYRLWAFDGDTLKRKMKIYNNKLILSTIKQNAFIAAINKKADFIFLDRQNKRRESAKTSRKIVFLKNNEWNVFYYDTKSGDTIQNKGMAESDLFSSYSKDSYNAPYFETEDFFKWSQLNSSENIQGQYFQKIKLKRPDYTSYGIWDGYLYTNVIVDKDTLKIKEFLPIDNDDDVIEYPLEASQKKPRYLYYRNPNLEYKLLTNRSGKLYMIKNKSKIQKKT